jgi:hypothetical protein
MYQKKMVHLQLEATKMKIQMMIIGLPQQNPRRQSSHHGRLQYRQVWMMQFRLS